MKAEIKTQAIKLRQQGWMLPAIQVKLKVARSTLSLWLRNLPLTKTEQFVIHENRNKGRRVAGEKKKEQRIASTSKILEAGKAEGIARANDSFFVSGLMLYWAEGAKTNDRVKFCNSDPEMISFMMSWFRKICNIEEKNFRICLHVHTLHMRSDIESYWSKVTGVPLTQFYKSQIKPTSLRQRKNILYNGTCTIYAGNVDLFRKMIGWKTGILEKLSQRMRG